MDRDRNYLNLGRQGDLSCSTGMWPFGEAVSVRDAYDDLLVRIEQTRTKPCYNCKGSGKVSGQQCTACHGTGSVPSA